MVLMFAIFTSVVAVFGTAWWLRRWGYGRAAELQALVIVGLFAFSDPGNYQYLALGIGGAYGILRLALTLREAKRG